MAEDNDGASMLPNDICLDKKFQCTMSQDFMTLIVILVTSKNAHSRSFLLLRSFFYYTLELVLFISHFQYSLHSKMKGIRYDGKSYIIVDTNGDGNCFYHSIVASNKVNITDAGILRKYIYEKVSEWVNTASQEMVVVLKIYGALQDIRVTLHEFINRQRQSGQWGSSIYMAFAAIVLNVHICSISNKMKEFDVFSTAKFFQVKGFDDYIHENAETVYI